MTGPRFVVERTPVSWGILDRRTDLIDVVVFPLEDTVAHVRARMTLEMARRHPEARTVLERKLRERLRRAGYTVVRIPAEVRPL